MSASNERPIDLHRIPLEPVVYQGEYPVSELFRLLESLSGEAGDDGGDRGQVRYRVEIAPDQRGIWLVTGEVEADVLVDCQRCFEAMPLHLHHQIRLAVVDSEAVFDRLTLPSDGPVNEHELVSEIASVPYESWLSEDGLIRIIDVVEDELILAIPVVTMHELDKCPQGHLIVANEPGAADVEADLEEDGQANGGRDNPFAVLKNFRA